ncbi:WD40 repeat domain-containing protein [Streptomyces sp. Isolate_45]|uniref:WD40 repeat domain-containing protein n=1 Tax=Streptomyces sp. Isolate_45 TaxID=2950111 RepID=UPI002481F4A4|nr:WD40 repeat domain-containing protein [Streptomyces sp. Isolate_45]MDA5285986.1 WD40 repeat domain-containing protein [Streptomyces sp. Isolate_45]
MRLLPRSSAATAATAVIAVTVLAALPTAALAAETPGAAGFTITDPRIRESSGLTASRLHPGVYWTHNDSDDGPYVYGVDAATGKTVARVTLTGIGTPRDVEAISLGPDGQLYVGDIGDNRNGTWDHVWVYRFPEPKQLADTTVKAEQFTVTYADGPRDAEALMVHPVTGRVYIASKHERTAGLYEGPERLSAGGPNVFRRVADVPWVTDGAFSPDGGRLTLRGYFTARTYPWKDGRPQGGGTRVSAPFQGQAESVTYTADGATLMFGSEGANSRVIAVPATDGAPDDGSSPAGPPASGAAPSGTASARPGSPPQAGGPAGEDGAFAKGALVLLVGTALVIGAKRLLRRGPKN